MKDKLKLWVWLVGALWGSIVFWFVWKFVDRQERAMFDVRRRQ